MNKFRNVPALITLLAGFITSVIMIVHRYSLVNFMWILIAVMVGFYICGVLIRFALNKVVQNKEDKENTVQEEEQEQTEEQETADEE
ncbi:MULTISPECIES: hypothetical protein [Clostridia]|jgi:phosphotransferase system  glucose/maltose/N-acetylglucosamine-specific IIC component|uniref:hypothetical protein n=1 Tax=Clostridia TaxID=186801 RepID=UPI000E5D2B99|nr:hypothetical protein [Eubacterium sp. AF22-9]RGS32831.1 hypothetical protein DWY02_05645 [Eubacterium sp. AF22-9]